MESRIEKMYFSQSSLEIFSKCKMKFKKRYLDGLFWRNWGLGEQETAKTEKGRLFHLLAYRYFLGLDSGIDVLDREYQELQSWVTRLKKFIRLDKKSLFYPEFELKLAENEMKLQAKFDLIEIENDGRVVIYDWKVQEKPLNKNKLEFSYQTIVYRYLLVKAGEAVNGIRIEPENVSMIYWQPTHPSIPVKIDYSSQLFEKDEEFIKNEINRILSCDFSSENIKTSDKGLCRHCEFCGICNDFQPEIENLSEDELEFDLDWDSVSEIEF